MSFEEASQNFVEAIRLQIESLKLSGLRYHLYSRQMKFEPKKVDLLVEPAQGQGLSKELDSINNITDRADPVKESYPRKDDILAQEVSLKQIEGKEAKQERAFSRGNSKSELLFLRICPSMEELTKNEPYSDESGKMLEKILEAMKYSHDHVYMTYLFSEGFDYIDSSSPAVQKALGELRLFLEEHSFKVIVAWGERVSQWLLSSSDSLENMRSTPQWLGNTRVYPSWEPFYLEKMKSLKKPVWQDMLNIKKNLSNLSS